jgi:hypothetical protein
MPRVPELELVLGSAPVAPIEAFEVAFADDDGEQRLELTAALSVPFESCHPVRRFPSYKGQRHLCGQWWTATTGSLVGYESWLERDRLVLLDFDPDVVGIASQPFWLFFEGPSGKQRSHVPDYFARLADGSALALDCRPADRIKPKDQLAFDATRHACAVLGWRYEIVDAPASTMLANVRWLAGYRHPRHGLAEVSTALRAVFAHPTRLLDGAEQVGDPLAVLPVLFHLLWHQKLHVELSMPLHTDAIVTAVSA